MKILFTSVGRRVELMQAFKNAANELGVDLTIIGADITDSAPALFFCDETKIVCRIREPEYIPQLLDICEQENVDCLIPTIDTDLLLLAENKEKFEAIGTKVLISAVDKVKLCRDKRFTADYFISLGLKSPLPVDDVEKYASGYPAFIKPKDGSSSVDAYKVNNENDLRTYAGKIADYIIQPFISGREFTIDIFCDYEGNPVYITPRERLAVRAGEVLKTRIHQDDVMIQEMLDLQNRLYDKCGKQNQWLTYTPDNAQLHWLYMLGEAGEVIDALKKNSLETLLQPGPARDHMIEEMADTLMFFVDTMACMNVTADELSQAYREKHERNVKRWLKD